jgi:hypothetical protein
MTVADLLSLLYIRVRPAWVRYSDYGIDPPQIVEFDAAQLRRGF